MTMSAFMLDLATRNLDLACMALNGLRIFRETEHLQY